MARHAQAHGRVEGREPSADRRYAEFRALLGEAQWRRLPLAIQHRFDRELATGESAVYLGEVAQTVISPIGWLWAQVARVVGAPLPLKVLAHTAAAVVVTADAIAGTQLWTRIYHESGRLPQVICSMKSFSGSTGLEERVGAGIAMALMVSVEERALVFRSKEYLWRWGHIALRIPSWLTPGHIEVRHREERQGRFSFTLSVVHPFFGRIIHQVAFFRDAC